jgi:hypothetical protein
MNKISDSVKILFDRTINRDMVHRSAVSEVFLTDLRVINEKIVLAGAQIPRCHGYFNDFTPEYADADPLMLLEIFRQAVIGGTHSLNVPKDTILISDDFELEIIDINVFLGQDHPIAVSVESHFDWLTIRRGQPRDMMCTQSMSANGVIAAIFRVSARLLSRMQLEALRWEQRGSQPPKTVGMKHRPHDVVVLPHVVGRYNPQNVVLSTPNTEEDVVRASIVPPWQNRALFDHVYDHLTMQLLTEAARQLVVIALSNVSDTRGQGWQIKKVKGSFVRFAEIDLPTIVTTKLSVPVENKITLSVNVIQAGNEVALIDFSLHRYLS